MSISEFLLNNGPAPYAGVSPFGSVDMDQQFLRLESAMADLDKAVTLHAALSGAKSISEEEARFTKSALDKFNDYQSVSLRQESIGSSNHLSLSGLTYRSEGIVDSIIEKIAAFFKWIGSAFSGLFGGSGGETSGAAGAAAAKDATEKVVASAASDDEFLFSENHPLFKIMDLNNLSKCKDYYKAVADSAVALGQINKKAIDLADGAKEEFQGDFSRDVVTALKNDSVNKTTSYAKAIVGSGLPANTFFAFPTKFLEAKALVFGESSITTNDSTFVGEGYTPKEVFISARDWKSVVDTFAQHGKLFYDNMKVLKESGEKYEKLAATVKSWNKNTPENVKKVGEGVKQLNQAASYTFRVLKAAQTDMDRLFKTLTSVAENDLRSAAEGKRKKDKEEEEKKNKPAVPAGEVPSVP